MSESRPSPSPFRSFAVVPAAGTSRRMGQQKLSMPWGESTVIESLLAAWRASRVSRIVVVVRSDDADLVARCKGPRTDVVTPPTPPPEMKDSVAAAIAHIQDRYTPVASDVWLLAPADMPQLSPHVTDQLIQAHDFESPSILVPVVNENRGHPVLLPWGLSEQISDLAENEGVNALLSRHPVRRIACNDPAILDDIDTPDDYRRMQSE